MVLKVPRPVPSRNGIYYLRVRIPRDLRAVFRGQREHKESLGTKNPEEAERRCADRLRAFRLKCENLRKGPQQLSERDAHRMAVQVFSGWCAAYQDNPSSQTKWRTADFSEIGARLAYPERTADFVSSPDQPPGRPSPGVPSLIEFSLRPAREMERIAKSETEQLAKDQGLVLDDVSHQRLERAVTVAIQKACLELENWTSNGFGETNVAEAISPEERFLSVRNINSVNFMDLFESWKAEGQPKAKTIYEWNTKVRKLEEFVGFADARRLTREHVVRWKDSLVAAGLAAKTINDSYLTAVRTVLEWGVANGRISSNSASGVRVRQRQKQDGKRGFSDEETATVLRAAINATDPGKKWIPLLLCYSGARLTEVSQLRRQDIREHGGFYTMSFTLEAGKLKTKGSERVVPLHPAVLKAGFLDFLSQAEEGALFEGLRPDNFGNRGGTATKRLGAWVRNLGIRDKRISPNHSWRHRFKTQARQCGIPENVSDAITGHSFKTEGNKYGEFPLELLYREMAKLPIISF